MANLVITRYEGESFVIQTPSGETITICLHRLSMDHHGKAIAKKKARFAIDAPREYTILRSELLKAE